jgi:hypothetical protein
LRYLSKSVFIIGLLHLLAHRKPIHTSSTGSRRFLRGNLPLKVANFAQWNCKRRYLLTKALEQEVEA